MNFPGETVDELLLMKQGELDVLQFILLKGQTCLKIDQSFVRHVVEDTDDQAIASTIVSIGKSLRLTVLAEGVETKAQLAWLCAQRCDFAQGYHFSPPLPPEDMAAMLRRQPFLTGE